MFFSRPLRQRLLRARLLPLLAIAIAFAGPHFLSAQTPTQTEPQSQAPSSLPSATPVPASSLPSIPAPTPGTLQTTPPAQPPVVPPPAAQSPTSQSAPTSAAPSAPPSQTDELTKPIQVPPPPAGTQVTGTQTTMPPASAVASVPGVPAYQLTPQAPWTDALGSSYIPVDSPVYPMAMRLYSMGYLDSAFISMRPWTRRSLLHMLDKTSGQVMAEGDPEAEAILAKLQEYLAAEVPGQGFRRGQVWGAESIYTRFMGIGGQTLRDSYHLGQTLNNDYGRPYEPGFNNVTGFSTVNEIGRFSLYVRGEYQHSPSGSGYSPTLTTQLSDIDGIPYPGLNNYNLNQATIPTGPIAAQNPFRIQEANLSFHVIGHEISFGKSDAWLGPAQGGAMAWSNNAENIYSFRINRVEPLHIPLVSDVLGPVRYDFFVGSLKGHTAPNDPWVHSEMFAFRPTSNFEFGFQRTIIWGGKGHGCLDPTTGIVTPCNEPITLHTFFKSFFDFSDTTEAEKYSRDDPGARYSVFNFSYRLPFLRRYVTLYTDSISHDDVTPISAPRRAAYRPGIFLSHIPRLEKLDFRIEAASTDTSTLRSLGGQFNYYETVQRQGYTNKGFIMGDWIGREAKGGQAWLTYHLSPDEWVQLEYLNKKTPKDFIPGGTTQNQFTVDVVKRLHKNIELNAWLQYEHWNAPIYMPTGPQSDTVFAVQVKFFPKLHTLPEPAAK